jgi:hypothetical protein
MQQKPEISCSCYQEHCPVEGREQEAEFFVPVGISEEFGAGIPKISLYHA